MKKIKKITSLIIALTMILNVAFPSLASVVYADEIGQTPAVQEGTTIEAGSGVSVTSDVDQSLASGGAIDPEKPVTEPDPATIEITSNNYQPDYGQQFDITYTVKSHSQAIEKMVVTIEFPEYIQVKEDVQTNDTYTVSNEIVGDKTVYTLEFLNTVQPESNNSFTFGLAFNDVNEETFSPMAKLTGTTVAGDINVEQFGQTILSSVYFSDGKGNLTITALNFNKEPVTGAVYEMRKDDQVLETLTTGVDGKAVSTQVYEPGEYMVVQTVAPSGYELQEFQTMVIIEEGILAELSFLCKEKSSLRGNPYGLKEVVIYLYDADTFEGLEGGIMSVRRANDYVLLDTYVTDENGMVLMDDLAPSPRAYSVQQEKPPYGYSRELSAHQFIFQIEEGGTQSFTDYYFDRILTDAIELTVMDEDNHAIFLEGAEFEVYVDLATFPASSLQFIDNPATGLITTITSGENGKCMTSLGWHYASLYEGQTYRIVQTKAAENYEIDSSIASQTVEVNQNTLDKLDVYNKQSVGDLNITKKAIDGTPIPDVQFEVKQGSTLIDTMTTGTNGVAVMDTTIDLVPGVQYTLYETVPNPNYASNFTPITFEVPDEEPYYMDVYNNANVGTVDITKVNERDERLQGAQFTLKKSSGAVQGVYTTNSVGEINLSGLPADTYTITETMAPPGYLINETSFVFSIASGGTQNLDIEVLDEKGDADIIITVTDGNGNLLPGAVFNILNGATLVTSVTTGADGVAYVNNLPDGTYNIVQTTAPANHAIQASIPAAVVNSTTTPVLVNVVNPLATGAVMIKKVDGSVGLPGAVFTLLGGTVNETLTTGSTGVAVSRAATLAPGTYTLTETTAPTGYPLLPGTPTITFTVTAATTFPINFEIENDLAINSANALKVTKVDEVTNAPLAGAVFDVKNSGGTVVQTYTTNASGEFTVSGLTTGTYTLVEKTPPSGYVLNNTIYSFPISSTGTTLATHTVKDAKLTHGVTFTKVDSVDNSILLPGATFEVRRAVDNVVVDTITTNSAGVAYSTINLPAGNYYVIETVAPSGYLLDATTQHPFAITATQTVPTPLLDSPIENVRNNYGIEVTKIGEDEYFLPGAVFEVYRGNSTNPADLIETITTDANGIAMTTMVYAPGSYTVKEITAPANYALPTTPTMLVTIPVGATSFTPVEFIDPILDGNIIINKKDAFDDPMPGVIFDVYKADGTTLVETITTGENGLAITSNVTTNGDYVIKERTPAGYTPTAPFTVTFSGTPVTTTVYNTIGTGPVRVKKVIEGTNTPIQGVKFSVLDANDNVVKSITTNVNGIANIATAMDPLPAGTYKLVETYAPAGYTYDPDEQYIFSIAPGGANLLTMIIENGKVNQGIQIKKTDAAAPTVGLEGAEFNIYAGATATGTPINGATPLVTNSNGEVVFPVTTTGTYTVKEVKAPENYDLPANAIQTVTVTTNSVVTATFTDTQSEGDVTVIKKDQIGNPIPNVEFEIRTMSNVVVANLKTGANGVAVTDAAEDALIGPGNYILVETNGPIDLDPMQPLEFTVGPAEDEVLTVYNTENLGKARVKKLDNSVPPLPIQGAIFHVYDADGNRVGGDYRTNVNGLTQFFTLPSPGTYVVKEVSVPGNYIMDPSAHVFTTVAGGAGSMTMNVINHKVTTGIRLIVTDQYGQPVEGSTFQILSGSNVVETVVTGSDGKVLSHNLPAGTYTVHQTGAPAGYSFAADVPVTVPANTIVDVPLINKVPEGNVYIKKVDSAGVGIPGVEFTIMQGSTTIGTMVTGANGIARNTVVLPVGTYTLEETVPPVGLAPIADITFVIDDIEVGASFEIVNSDEVDAIDVTKFELGTTPQLVLPNAEFKIYMPDGTTEVINHSHVTDVNGEFTDSTLDPGTYILKETKAPDGYAINPTQYVFTITEGVTGTAHFDVSDEKLVDVAQVHLLTRPRPIDSDPMFDQYPIKGAVFEVRENTSTGALVDTITTDANGYAYSDELASGTYSIVQITTDQNFDIALAQSVTIVADGLPDPAASVTFINDLDLPSPLVVNLRSSQEPSGPIEGVTYTVYRDGIVDAAHIHEVLVTGPSGIAVSEKPYYDHGSYLVVQTPKPGYNVDQGPKPLVYDGEEPNKSIDFTNSPIITRAASEENGGIVMNVTDANGKPVSGVKFELYNEATGASVGKYKTNANGKLKIDVKETGSYKLVLSSVPSGYEMEDSTYYFNANASGTVFNNNFEEIEKK